MGGHKKQYQKQKSQITTRKCAWGVSVIMDTYAIFVALRSYKLCIKLLNGWTKKKKVTFKGRLGRVWRGLSKCLRMTCLLQLKLTFYAKEKLVFCYRIKQPKNTRAPLK